jgi:hypothetical protein
MSRKKIKKVDRELLRQARRDKRAQCRQARLQEKNSGPTADAAKTQLIRDRLETLGCTETQIQRHLTSGKLPGPSVVSSGRLRPLPQFQAQCSRWKLPSGV